jgi:hypothetical protein
MSRRSWTSLTEEVSPATLNHSMPSSSSATPDTHKY